MEQNCNKCGAVVQIVPPGTSRKTGKPYGAFYKCKGCQFSENVGQQPAKTQADYNQPSGKLPSPMSLDIGEIKKDLKWIKAVLKKAYPDLEPEI